MEYFIGGDPQAANPLSFEIKIIDLSGTPSVELLINLSSAATDIDYFVDRSTDLSTWEEIVTSIQGSAPTSLVGPSVVPTVETSPFHQLRVTAPAAGEKSFFRIRVQSP